MTTYRRNWRQVKITTWHADRSYTHIRLASGADDAYRGLDAGVVQLCTDSLTDAQPNAQRAAIHRVIKIGEFAQLIKRQGEIQLSDEMSIHDFAEMIGDVITTSDNRIAELRGQLEDLCDDEDRLNLDDDEVAFLGWICTELYVEQARELDNPFIEKQSIAYPIIDVLEQYCPSKPQPPRHLAHRFKSTNVTD